MRERLATLFDAACSDHDSPLRPWSALYGRYYLDVPDDTDIGARIKISSLGPGEYKLAAEISLPGGFRLVRCEPQLFEVLIR